MVYDRRAGTDNIRHPCIRQGYGERNKTFGLEVPWQGENRETFTFEKTLMKNAPCRGKNFPSYSSLCDGITLQYFNL